MKAKIKIEKALLRRLNGYDQLLAKSKTGGRGFRRPGSRNPKKQG